MNFKWAVGAMIAVLAATILLPGVVSAHDGHLQGEPTCRDAEGYWSVNWTVDTTFVDSSDYLVGLTVDVNDGGVADDLHLGDFDASLQDPGNTSGSATTTYGPGDDPHSSEFGANDVNEFTGNIEYIEFDSGFTSGYWNYGISNIITQPDYCNGPVCVDGETADLPLNVQGTNDCDPVRICVDGESMTVTRFEAEQLGGERGSCVPTENPPPPPPETPEEPVEEVQESVAEVSPAIEEVAALPAAGQGDVGGDIFSLTLVLGLVLIGVGGGATAMVARRS